MALACVRVSSYCFISARRRSLVCASLVPGRRSSGLPLFRPSAISRKEFKSLPSRNTASGFTPSTVRNSLALLPMRCVNITSWPTADSSVAEASCCSFNDDTVSAVSSRSADWRLMARSAWPTWVSVFCWPSTWLALRSARSTSGKQRFDRFLHGRRRRGQFALAAAQAAHVGRQHRGGLAHLGESLRAADQRLRHRLGQTLRLHQRLAHGAGLAGAAIGRAQRQHGARAPGPASRPARSRRGCAAAAAAACCR